MACGTVSGPVNFSCPVCSRDPVACGTLSGPVNLPFPVCPLDSVICLMECPVPPGNISGTSSLDSDICMQLSVLREREFLSGCITERPGVLRSILVHI